MFKNFDNKKLLIVFVLLLGGILLQQYISSKKGERTFKKELVSLDSASVDGIILYPKSENFSEVKLTKENDLWEVQKGELKAPADQGAVASMLSQLSAIKPMRLAATTKDKWMEYEVVDSVGTRVKILENGKITNDIIIGKFTFNQTQRSGLSFVRNYADNEVYATDGFISMGVNQGFNAFRNKTVVKSAKEDLTGLTFVYPADSGFSLQKSGEGWTASDNAPVDSAAIESYLNQISNASQSAFQDGFSVEGKTPDFVLTITGNNQAQPIKVEAYPGPDSGTVVVHSNLNPEAWFKGEPGGFFEKLFVSRGSLIPKEVE